MRRSKRLFKKKLKKFQRLAERVASRVTTVYENESSWFFCVNPTQPYVYTSFAIEVNKRTGKEKPFSLLFLEVMKKNSKQVYNCYKDCFEKVCATVQQKLNKQGLEISSIVDYDANHWVVVEKTRLPGSLDGVPFCVLWIDKYSLKEEYRPISLLDWNDISENKEVIYTSKQLHDKIYYDNIFPYINERFYNKDSNFYLEKVYETPEEWIFISNVLPGILKERYVLKIPKIKEKEGCIGNEELQKIVKKGKCIYDKEV